MNINTIKSFITLCQFKNISKASKYLNISQQGLSRQIKSLESELDVKLLERNRNGVTVTECALQILPHLKSVLDSYNTVNDIADNFKKTKDKTIKLGVSHGVFLAIGAEFVEEFKNTYNDLSLELIELFDNECYDSLISQDVDFALLIAPFNTNDIIATRIFEAEPYVVVNTNHVYASTKKFLTLKDLHNQPVMGLNEQRNLRKQFDNAFISNDVKPQFLVSSLTYRSYEYLVNDTVAIAVIMEYLIPMFNSKDVKILPLVDGPKYDLHFCSLENRVYSKTLKNFQSFILNYFNHKDL